MKQIWMVYPYGPVYGDIGKECRYTQFGRELARNGYEVIWWTANFSHDKKIYRCDGWKKIYVTENFFTYLVPTSAYKRNISLLRIKFEKNFSKNLLQGFLKYNKPDLIIVASTGMFNAFEPCTSYAIQNKIPIIYDIMDIPLIENYMKQHHKLLVPIANIVMWLERKRETKFFKTISGICALGINQLEYAKKRAFFRKIPSCLIYNGIDVELFRKKMKENIIKVNGLYKNEGWIWCVFSGSLGPSYDIETICKCALMCEKNRNKIKFIIVGNGPQVALVKDFSSKCKNIEYLGYISLDKLSYVYSLCDIGLCAFSGYSTVDMPDKFYDYCAGGLAILNTLQGEIKDYIENYQLGKQYRAGDADDLYKQILAISKPRVLEHCKSNAYKIGTQFDIKVQVKKLSDMVNKILLEDLNDREKSSLN